MEGRNLAIIGAGGHAKVVISTLLARGERPRAVFDADPTKWGTDLLGIPVLGDIQSYKNHDIRQGILAIGDNRGRQRLAAELDLEWVRAIHPHSWIDPSATVGPGSVVFAGAVIQPGTCLGAHVIVNTGATADHDCTLGNFVHLAPGGHLAGGVSLGEGSMMGVGSSAIPGIRVGAWARVGAGAVLIRDVAAKHTVVGVPAHTTLHQQSQTRD
jgi:sugar O-acyltransferase (sialic acid O-acetyltransferase NeuD family)